MCRNRSPWSVQEWIPARRIIPGQSDLFLYIWHPDYLILANFTSILDIFIWILYNFAWILDNPWLTGVLEGKWKGGLALNSVQFRLNPGQSMIDRCFGGKMKRRLSFENRNLEWTKFGRLSRIHVALYRNRPDSSSYSLLVNIARASSTRAISFNHRVRGWSFSGGGSRISRSRGANLPGGANLWSC